MTKKDVIDHIGHGSRDKLLELLGIGERMWRKIPDPVPRKYRERIIGICVLEGRRVPAVWREK
jgi:hypothetical protein